MKLLDTNSIKGKMPMNKSNHIHQGNVRAVVSQSGVLEEVNGYYPYGGITGAPATGVQARKYGGKELDRENGLDWLDSKARMYDFIIGRTPTQDPMAEKYYHISPYLWCAGNPINFIDKNGLEVHPMSETALHIIKYGLTPAESKYISLDKNGFIDASRLGQGFTELINVGDNYTSLASLVNMPSIVEVYTSTNYTTSEGNYNMKAVHFESELDVMYELDNVFNQTKEVYATLHQYSQEKDWNGEFGITLYPDEGLKGLTLNGNWQIIINDSPLTIDATNGLKKMASTFAHEGYGHALFKFLGLPHSHGTVRSLDPTMPGNNYNLEKQIYERENEAERNFDTHFYSK